MATIKNIIFDLGGVILNIDYQLPVKAFKELGLENFEQWYSQKSQNDLFDRLETGRISPGEFRNEVKKYLSTHATDQQIDAAWNAILLDLPIERIKLLQAIRKNYRSFLLSNTNEIHITAFSVIIEKAHGMSTFNNLFEKIYYSSRINMRKPHKEAFELVLKENGLLPEETVFIDDSIQHIEGARKAGIYAIYLDKDKTILDLFDSHQRLIS